MENAFGAWTQAIADAGLSWQYRQVENGEWNLDDSISAEGDDGGIGHHFEQSAPDQSENEPSTEKQPSQTVTAAMESVLARPLPWEHIDTGIEKRWLQDDLKKALEAAVVPDCSFEGCSHCGICGPDFGHNIVVKPPAIPDFIGHFEPNHTRAQRIRITVGKLGDMALIGHLDFARLMDRAIRRASLPIAFSGGFHPGPRISPANALSLGLTSTGEIIDFELTETLSPQDFKTRLAAQLPADVPIYEASEISLQLPSATKSLDRAEYLLAMTLEADQSGVEDAFHWQALVQQVRDTEQILYTKTTKSGKQKEIDLRSHLFEIEVVSPDAAPAIFAALPKDVCDRLLSTGQTIIRYVGSCRNDGTLLRPSGVVSMMESIGHQTVTLGHIHRMRLMLNV